MSPTRWQQIEDVFQAALDRAPEERLQFVSECCGGDAELQGEVERLLAQYDEAEDFIESPVWTDSKLFNSSAKREIADSLEKDFSQNADGSDRMIGKRVGVYKLAKELGRGGMGAVYLAERADGEFRQRVAVKLIKRGMDTDFIVRRFRHERQILAALDHPNIARLLDGGTTADGLPYFVMEFIEGEPLHRYADARRLSLRDRIRLFQKICSAVSYAHERQIVHRDIKPGNILITPAGVPKLLDFGIAKILDPDLIHESINPTSTMMRMMTPEYASPEQVRGLRVTPASDVYALGVLFYELISGHRPYNFAGRSAHEISRVICESQPELPSKAVAASDNLLAAYATNQITTEKAAELRGANVEILQREIAGSLDDITLKTLCKDAAGRYRSVVEFSDDIARYLDGKTVVAEPCAVADDGFLENAPLTEISTGTGSKSLAVLPFKLLNAIMDENTGDKFLGIGLADALITRLSNVRRFVVRPTSSVLRYGEERFDPLQAGRDLGVEFVLDGHIQKASNRIRVSVQLLSVTERATVWAERFDEKFTDVLSLEDVISTQVAEALVPRLTGDEREQLAKRGTDDPEAFEAYLRGRYHFNTFTEEGFAKAIVAYNQAVALDPGYALAFAGIADYYCWLGVYGVMPPRECFAAAVEAAEKAIALDPKLSEAHASLGFAVTGGDYDWARGEAACRRALELNANNAAAHVWYSFQLAMEGRFIESEKHAARGIELDPLTPFNQYNLAWSLYYARRFDDSIRQYEKTLAAHPLYSIAHVGIAWVFRLVGRGEEALSAVRRGQELTGESMFLLTAYAQTLAAAGEREEAENVLRQIEQTAANRFVSSYHLAIAHCFLGNNERALVLLETAFDDREAWMVWMGVEPAFDPLRSEPRFTNLLERTGNPIFFRANTVELEAKQHLSQVTTQPIEKSKTAQPSKTRNPKSEIRNPKLKWVAAAVAVLLVVFVGSQIAVRYGWQMARHAAPPQESAASPNQMFANPPETKPVRAIAVLPFTTVNAKSDDEQYLGVGTADLVTNKLSQLKEVNLRSSSSVRRYLKTTKSPVEIGKELAVNYVVSGTIERAGNRVAAKLNLTDIADGSVVWSESFEQPNANLFALQDEISERIANSLSLQLTSAEKAQLVKHFTENNEAEQLYLAGRYHFGKRTVEGLRQAIALFEQAIEKDPKFALAYTGLADCNALLNWYQEPPPADAWEKAKQAAARAVALDDNLAEAHSSRAFIKFHYERDYAGAGIEFERAIALRQNYATAYQWYAFMLSAQARHDEAVAMMQRAERLEPRSAVIATAVANVLFHARRYDEAIEQTKHALEIDPGSVAAHVVLRWTYEKKGMAAEALAIYEKERAFAGDTPTTKAKRAHVLAAIGETEEARRIVETLVKNRQTAYITPYEIAIVYSLLNDREQGLRWLVRARDEHAVGFSFVRVDPHLDNLRGDPRFAALLP